MHTKIRHVAILTDHRDAMTRFYKTIFGMRQFTNSVEEDGRINTERGQITDGVIGLAILNKSPGLQSGLDHFGFQVEDREEVLNKIRGSYPEILMTKGFDDVPFAATRIHDPAGVHIDVAQKSGGDLKGGYAKEGWDQPRHFHHLAIRASKPTQVAEFYQTIFEMSRIPEWPVQNEICLSDGQSYLVIRPCEDTSYRRMKQGFDHLGFKVEDLAAAKKDLQEMATAFPDSAPRKVGTGRTGATAVRDMETCPMGKHVISDSDGVLIDLLT